MDELTFTEARRILDRYKPGGDIANAVAKYERTFKDIEKRTQPGAFHFDNARQRAGVGG